MALADVRARSGRSAAFLPALLALVLTGSALGAAEAGPVLVNAPVLTGSPTQGNRLFATPGSWHGAGTVGYRYKWYRCDPMGGSCAILRGVAAGRYRLGANDVGHTIAVNVRATDSAGATNGYSNLIGPVAGSGSTLRSLVQPAISGTAALGGSIQVDTGKWSPTPKSFVYQWIRCNTNGRGCAPIVGDRGPSHAIVRRDVKHSLVAVVQALTGSGARAVVSRASPPVGVTSQPPPPGGNPPPPPPAAAPALATPPSVGSVVRQGKKLTGAAGTWKGSGITYAYQWYRCDPAGAHCKSIHGSTKPTYTQVGKDVGNTLGLTVRATNATGTTAAYASVVGPVAPRTSPLYSTGQPAIKGSAVVGQTLHATTGNWSETPTGYAYSWQRCNANGRICAPIAGATTASYTVTTADVGHAVIAAVKAAVDGISQVAWSVAVSAAAPPGPVNSARPTVAGEAVIGKQLTGAAGTWSGSGTITYAYQWYRCDAAGAHCKSIHGSTKSTYTEVPKDLGNTLGLTVRATDTTGTASAYASLIGPVAARTSPLFATAQPTISGTPAPGQTVQVSTGSWSQPPTAYNYRWERCNANGRLCALIPSVTAAGYTVTAADSGHTLVGLVQATAGALTQPTVSVGAAVG